MPRLNESVQYLPGVGPKMAEKLERLGIETIRDLLFYYPRHWDDFSRFQKILTLKIDDDAIIKAKILSIRQSRTRRRWMSIIEAILEDDSGQIRAIWFNQPFLMNVLKAGGQWLFAGRVGWDFKSGAKTISISQYEKEPVILPVYPETEGLTSKYLRKLINPLLKSIDIQEYLPSKILKSEDLVGLNEAIKDIHFPKNQKTLSQAKKRLAFDELFFIALRMQESKKELSKSTAIALTFDEKILKDFVKSLPFQLTNAQRKSAWEIICDLKKSQPMNRLLEGDVGSGKTVVAAMAALVTAKSGFQTVWLAPTEILANQHYQNISDILKPFKIKIGLWTSVNKKANLKKDDVIIGTHALIQKDIAFKNLALIIVDEQHRFGVKQRAQLKLKTNNRQLTTVPHFLSMTATPIPRTLALAFYGDLNLSIIDEMPRGRQNIITKVVPPKNRSDAYSFIGKQIEAGRQAFVICPLIEEAISEKKLFDVDRKSAIKEYEKLSKEIFPHLKVGLLHGKMKPHDKEETMEKFKNDKIDIIVSTAVIEVGIDIPNATVMMIESAERFGLAQLHQFRGRVGRGKHQSYCLLFSDAWSENTKKRLSAMITCDNGFNLAQIDLDLRGPGELSGIRQSGLPDLKMASLSDRILIEKARIAAEKVIEEGIDKYPELEKKLAEYLSTKHLE